MLDYIALGSLIFIGASLLSGAIAIIGIPHRLAEARNHPHQEAIYYAGWVSLFTLHTIWPLLLIWSAAYRDQPAPAPRFVQMSEDTAINDKPSAELHDIDSKAAQVDEDITDSVALLGHRYEALDDRLERIEKAIMAATEAA